MDRELKDQYSKLKTQSSAKQKLKRSGKIFNISLGSDHIIALNSDMIVGPDFEWDNVNSQKVESFVNIFESFLLVKNTLYV